MSSRIAAALNDCSAVVVTGFHPEAPQADLRGLGGPTLRLCKPFDGDAFLERLAGMVHGSATPAAPRRRASDALAAAGPGHGFRRGLTNGTDL